MSEDYLNTSTRGEGMPSFIANPNQKKVYEEEARQQLSNVNRQTPAPEQQQLDKEEKVILRNNRAHAQHFVGENTAVIIPGQVSQEPKGPFAFIAKTTLESEMPLLMALEKSANGRRAPLSIIDRDQYMEEYRDFNEKRKDREKKDQFNNRSVYDDEIDEAQEGFKVNYNVLDNVQPDKAIPDYNNEGQTIGPKINID